MKLKSTAFQGKTLFTNVFFSSRGISRNLKLLTNIWRNIAKSLQTVISSWSHLISLSGIVWWRVQKSQEKKLTLEKDLDIVCAAKSTAAQMKVRCTESGLNAVKERERERERKQSDDVPFVSDSRIKDSVVGTTKDAIVQRMDRSVFIVRRRIILLLSARPKVKCPLFKNDSI